MKNIKLDTVNKNSGGSIKSSARSFITVFSLIVLALTAISSCTKVIDLKLGNVSGLLVIEGNVTNIRGTQIIKLSRNVAFTSTNTYPPVTGATVSVTDSLGNSHVFTEGPAGIYTNSQFRGVTGQRYTMAVTTGGTTYKANSTMPQIVHLDSITSLPRAIGNGNLRDISVHFLDPLGVANQYRFVMYVNSVQVNAVFAYNDEFIDGRYVNLQLIQTDIDIHPGDTARIEMQCIDKPIYTYWFTLMQQGNGAPGGGITPTNPPTNITPNTLGYFSAHTTQALTLVVK